MQDRAIATRAAVIRAAAEMFEERGFHGASISDILTAARVTKGGLYFHFPSKEALAAAIIEEQSAWRVTVEDRERPLQQLIDLSHAFAQALQNDPLVRASIRLTLERETFGAEHPTAYQGWIDAVTQLLARADDRGQLRGGADHEALARVLVAVVTGAQLMSEATTGRGDLRQRITEIWEIVLPPVITDEALVGLDMASSRIPAPPS